MNLRCPKDYLRMLVANCRDLLAQQERKIYKVRLRGLNPGGRLPDADEYIDHRRSNRNCRLRSFPGTAPTRLRFRTWSNLTFPAGTT